MADRSKIDADIAPSLPGLAVEAPEGVVAGTPLPLLGLALNRDGSLDAGGDAGDGAGEAGGSRAGRPKGAKNKRQETLQKWLFAKGYRHPAVILAETYSRPVDELAKALSCKKAEAFHMQLRAAEALMPYFEGKIAPVTFEGETVIPMLNINLGTNSLASVGVQAGDDGGWSLSAQFQQNQGLRQAVAMASNDQASNDQAEDVQFQEVDHDAATD